MQKRMVLRAYAILPRDNYELFPAMYKLTGQDEIFKTYFFPKSYVSYRKPRAVSTGQRERARQMMIGQNRAIGRKDYPGN